MAENNEMRKKTTRKGIPHHQDELPGLSGLNPSDDKKTPITQPTNIPSEIILPKDSRSLREQKNQSVLRNRFNSDNNETVEDSMVERVVDNLLHGDDARKESKVEEEDITLEMPEPIEEIIAEEEESEPVEIELAEMEKQGEEEENQTLETQDLESEEREESAKDSVDEDDEQEEESKEKEFAFSANRGILAKKYEKIHNVLFAVDISITIVAILAFLFFGASRNLRDWIIKFTENAWLVPLIYSAVVTIVYYFVILIPLHGIDFHFENKFKLNTQSFSSWLDDNFKSLLLNMILMALFLEVTYFLLRNSPNYWWIWAAGVWTLFGVLMANLVPVLILPLFYKLKPLKDEILRERLKKLADRVRMKVLNVFEIRLSAKTRKANAMLAGLGNTKRVILGDTLIENYTGDEIETIIAHELGHHYHLHMQKLIALGTVLAFAGFFLAHLFLGVTIGRFEYLDINGVDDIAGFPLLLIAIFLFGILTMPLNNTVARAFEKQSDKFALRLTDRPNEFISAMKKLADQNLSDKEPSAIIEILLHDHPSISSRIAVAEDYSVRKRT
jgi:STE24 endopeptidase